MRRAVWLYLLFSLAAFGQDCTTYVIVGAFDRTSGDDIDHLKADDFQARMSGRILSVVSAAQNFNSRLLVLMETDGLAKNDKLGDEINLATRIARQAPEGKPVAFGVYAGRAVFTKGFISETEPRARAISDVREEGGSLGKKVALYDSLLHGLELFGPHQPGDTVLLIGDPYDDGSRHSDSDVEKEFLRTGTRFLVVLRQDLSRVSRDFLWNNHEREKEFFSELPARTGGAYTDFNAHFLATFAWRGYMLGLKVPGNLRQHHKWKLQFRNPTAEEHRKTALYYPAQLPACSSAPVGPK